MPRQSRIDTSGALHHVICRGIDCQEIIQGKDDYSFFLKRLGDLLMETKTSCFAWALIPNHFHLLLRTGNVPISGLIKKYRLKAKGYNLDKLITRIAEITKVSPDGIFRLFKGCKKDSGKKYPVLWGNGKAWNISKPFSANAETIPIVHYLCGSPGEGDCREKFVHDWIRRNRYLNSPTSNRFCGRIHE